VLVYILFCGLHQKHFFCLNHRFKDMIINERLAEQVKHDEATARREHEF
jgi:hypothetical protein